MGTLESTSDDQGCTVSGHHRNLRSRKHDAASSAVQHQKTLAHLHMNCTAVRAVTRACRPAFHAANRHRHSLVEGCQTAPLRTIANLRVHAFASMVAAPSPSAIAGLEPAAVWKFFGNLADLPRPSKHEQKVQAFLKDFAQARGLEVQSDAAGKSRGHVTSSADDTACTVWEPSGGRCAGSEHAFGGRQHGHSAPGQRRRRGSADRHHPGPH